MYNKELLNKWNMTEEQCDKAIREITLKGYRLSYDEKEDLLYFFEEGLIARDDVDAQISHVEFGRKLAREFEEDKKLTREFVKEWRRLSRKYDLFDEEDKSLDELVEMWLDNHFELHFMEKLGCLKYYGAKQYAQVYCHNVGICPASEVEMWE